MAIHLNTLTSTLLRERIKLTSYIWSILRDIHETDDVFQEVCLKAIDHRDQLKDVDHVLAWTRRTARNLALNVLRKRKHTPLLLSEQVLEMLESEWAARDQQSTTDVIDALRGCVGKLSSAARQIVKLRYVDNYKSAEVAQITNRNAAAVYKALTRIHRQLANCIHQQLATEKSQDVVVE